MPPRHSLFFFSFPPLRFLFFPPPPRCRVPFLLDLDTRTSPRFPPSLLAARLHALATSRRPSKVLLQPRGWNTNGGYDEGLTPLWTEFLGLWVIFFLFLSRGRGSNRMFHLFSWRFRGWMGMASKGRLFRKFGDWFESMNFRDEKVFFDFWIGIIYHSILYLINILRENL